MAFAWLIILISALVGTRATNKLRRSQETQKEGEYIPVNDSDSETESEDWEATIEAAEAAAELKGKAKAAPEKEKASVEATPMKRKSLARKRGRFHGVQIREPTADNTPPETCAQISSQRMKDFEHRECIGERHVNVAALKERSGIFASLFDQAGFAQICNFPETTGYCLHLVRTFYACAHELQENENGPMQFSTSVRNSKLTITPQLIGEVLGMSAQLQGTHYVKGQISSSKSWRMVVDGICMPDTRSAGNSVLSKELKPKYRFLNFIVCYNVLPNMQTKVLRWDRMLYLYLLGHPSASRGLNLNIPYLIWSRMAKYVESPHPKERLPYPMIIMRIFRKFDVDIRSSTHMHSLGTINDTTIVKSLSNVPDDSPIQPRGKRPSASTSTRQTSTPTAPVQPQGTSTHDTSDDEASVTSIYREQRRLSFEQEQIAAEQRRLREEFQIMTAAQVTLTKKQNKLTKLVKKVLRKMGCSSSEDSDSG